MFAIEWARKRESAQLIKSRRKTETAAVRKRVFGKSYRLVQLVESNDMYDRLVLCYYSASTIFTLF